MKFQLILPALCFLATAAFSQSNNTLSVQYGTSSNGMNILGAIGDFGYTGKGGSTFGLGYTRRLNSFASVITGLQYDDDKLLLDSFSSAKTVFNNEEIKIVTIPVLGKITFLKYAFIDAGFLFDFETNTPENTITSKQSGIGFEAGVGLQYNWEYLNIFINPYLQEHAIDKFGYSRENFYLNDSGFKFGLGYNF